MMKRPKFTAQCCQFLHCEVLEASNGKATTRSAPTKEMENPSGNIQGGILAGIIDCTFGSAIASLIPDRKKATIQMTVNYLDTVKAGDKIIGTANVIKKGLTQVYMEAKLERENDGNLLAKSSTTVILLNSNPNDPS